MATRDEILIRRKRGTKYAIERCKQVSKRTGRKLDIWTQGPGTDGGEKKRVGERGTETVQGVEWKRSAEGRADERSAK
jgi:hypothetical protein